MHEIETKREIDTYEFLRDQLYRDREVHTSYLDVLLALVSEFVNRGRIVETWRGAGGIYSVAIRDQE